MLRLDRKIRALCTDGVVRSTRVTGEQTVLLAYPASTHVRGRKVSGFLTKVGRRYYFWANREGTNADILPRPYYSTYSQFVHS